MDAASPEIDNAECTRMFQIGDWRWLIAALPCVGDRPAAVRISAHAFRNWSFESAKRLAGFMLLHRSCCLSSGVEQWFHCRRLRHPAANAVFANRTVVPLSGTSREFSFRKLP